MSISALKSALDVSRYSRAVHATTLALPSIPGAMAQVLVAPEGMSAAACPACDRYQPGSLFEHTVGFKFRCAHCSVVSSTADFNVDLQACQQALLDDSQVRKASWYHVSIQKNWLANVSAFKSVVGGKPMVHVGSKEAAMDRVRDIGRRPVPLHLYEVHLRANAELAPGLFRDEDRWPKMSSELAGRNRWPGFSRFGATRYVNHYEASGSISLIVNCDALELVSHEVVAGGC